MPQSAMGEATADCGRENSVNHDPRLGGKAIYHTVLAAHGVVSLLVDCLIQPANGSVCHRDRKVGTVMATKAHHIPRRKAATRRFRCIGVRKTDTQLGAYIPNVDGHRRSLDALRAVKCCSVGTISRVSAGVSH